MLEPTARLLDLLELLQARPLTTGREIADRLEIDRRTVRRYVAALQELGIPVEGQRGVGGGYRMRPGFRLPPLMLSDDEAVAVVLGLVAARRLGLDGGEPSRARSRRSTASSRTRSPPGRGARGDARLHRRRDRPAPGAGDAVLRLAEAIRRRRRAAHRATGRSRARRRERELSPHGLVVHSGRWYLAAHDHGRDDLRTFRVDRMWRRRDRGRAALAPRTGSTRSRSQPLARARAVELGGGGAARPPARRGGAARIRATLAELVETEDGTLLRMRVELAGLDGGRARRPRLPFHDPPAGRAARRACGRWRSGSRSRHDEHG